MTTQPKTYLEQAIEDGHVKIAGDGKTQRIHYVAASHSERWSDPEGKVRAELRRRKDRLLARARELELSKVNVCYPHGTGH